MDYDLDRMEPATFEALSQSLFQGFLGPTCKIFGRGPDGQREAVCQIDNPLDICGRQISGRTFLQAKHKGKQTKGSDLSWLKNELKQELYGLAWKKKTEPAFVPQHYFFFTNIVLTPPKDKGVKDQIDKYVESYKNVVSNIYVIGRDEICSMLDNNRDVRAAFFSFLVSGDVLHEIYEWMINSQEQSQRAVDEALLRFIEYEFREDLYSRLEQAGDLKDSKITLEKVFVDLKASRLGTAGEDDNYFISNMIREGNRPLKSTAETVNNMNSYVLLGEAGQGKSTIVQYLAQIYRASLLKLDNTCATSEHVESFIKCFAEDYGYEIKCVRTPIKIILKDYAAWISKNEDSACGVLDYVVYQINRKTSEMLTVDKLRESLKTRSWLFIFDGLDEVPASSNRAEMLKHISGFIDIELRRLNCDALIAATSRQQGYNEDFSQKQYVHLNLLEMDKPICKKYLGRLTEQLEPSLDRRDNIITILTGALDDPNQIVSQLMRRPLHVGIVTILVLSGGEPPRDKYALFKEYTDIIIRRERQKNVSRILNEYEEDIIKIHEEAAYRLQEESSKPGNPAAVLSKQDVISLIKHRLSERESDITSEIAERKSDNNDLEEKEDRIYQIIAHRLSYMSEIHDGEAAFPIRSIQEYFAANFLIKHRPEKEIIGIIKRIAQSGYWRNVLIFMVSNFMKERKHLEGSIDSLCGELNGSAIEPDKYDLCKGAQMGAWLALDLLHENLFANRPKVENKYIKHASNILKQSWYSSSAYKISTLPRNTIDKFITLYLRPYLEQFPDSRNAWIILWSLVDNDNQTAVELASDILKQPNADLKSALEYSWTRSDRYENSLAKARFLMPYITDWLKQGRVLPSNLSKIVFKPAFIEEFRANRKNHDFTKGFIRSILHNLFSYGRYPIDFYPIDFYRIDYKKIYEFILPRHDLYPDGRRCFSTTLPSHDLYLDENRCFSTSLPIVELDENELELMESLKSTCTEINLIFFVKWAEFLMTRSKQALIDMIKAYYEEDKSDRYALHIYFRYFALLDIVLADCLSQELSCDETYEYIVNSFDDTFRDYEQKCLELKMKRESLNEQKYTIIRKYIRYRINIYADLFEGIKSFIAYFKIKPYEIYSYSVEFINQLVYVFEVTCSMYGMEVISKEKENLQIISNIFNNFQITKVVDAFDRRNFRRLVIFFLASLPPQEISESKFIEFQDEGIVEDAEYIGYEERASFREASSIVLLKIIKRVRYQEMENESLKIIPYMIPRIGDTDFLPNSEDITAFESIKCENPFNELGRLLICLFSDTKDISNDFIELTKKLSIIFITNFVTSVIKTHNVYTKAAVKTSIALYTELINDKDKKYAQMENYKVALAQLEGIMFKISADAICTPLDLNEVQ